MGYKQYTKRAKLPSIRCEVVIDHPDFSIIPANFSNR